MIAFDTTPKRPSQARIRKSIVINDDRKEVTWCPTEETVHEIESYDRNDYQNVWYSQDELKEIRASNDLIVAKFQDEQDVETEHETMRGLEMWTDEGGWSRFQAVRECMNRVLDEQDRQWGVDSTEIQNTAYPIVKKINHMHVPFDHQRLGAICRDATAPARRAAMIRGRRDVPKKEEEATFVQKVERKIQGLNVKELAKKFERASDNETVQTEAMTDTGSVLSGETLPEDQPRPPVPTEVAIQIKIQSLQEKHKARFAAYMSNRQQRIEARMQRDYEWEQRRLARKAILNQEYEEHLEKMYTMIRKTNELIRFVEASRQ